MTPVALIVHARPRPEHLDLCLASLYGQTHTEFEILVAEAGGADENDEVVAHHARHLAQRLRHIHAPGTPHNQARALNAAVLSADAEYLVFLGGDCLAQPDFIAEHVARADYGHFVHGETLALDGSITSAVGAGVVGSGQVFDEHWLHAMSPAWHEAHLRSNALTRVRDWLRKDTPGQQYWNCESSSCFRADLGGVNGFDMDVDDWRQDRDVANRLQNNGLEPVKTGPAGNVLRLLDPALDEEARRGGRLPATLAPAGVVRAAAGLDELTAGATVT